MIPVRKFRYTESIITIYTQLYPTIFYSEQQSVPDTATCRRYFKLQHRLRVAGQNLSTARFRADTSLAKPFQASVQHFSLNYPQLQLCPLPSLLPKSPMVSSTHPSQCAQHTDPSHRHLQAYTLTVALPSSFLPPFSASSPPYPHLPTFPFPVFPFPPLMLWKAAWGGPCRLPPLPITFPTTNVNAVWTLTLARMATALAINTDPRGRLFSSASHHQTLDGTIEARPDRLMDPSKA